MKKERKGKISDENKWWKDKVSKKEKSITKKFIKWNIQDKNKECNPNKKKKKG